MCEESQEVCKAFRAKGHEAYSNDLIECSGGHPEWHLQMDAFEAICLKTWDLIVMHPPCTKIALSGNRWYGDGMLRHQERLDAIEWTQELWDLACSFCDGVAMENPVGTLNKYGEFPTPQYVQPWQFGHGETKKTGLWLYGLPPLQPTNIVEGREQRIWKMSPSPERSKLRSKTFPGIAKAMAEQYGTISIEQGDHCISLLPESVKPLLKAIEKNKDYAIELLSKR